MCVGGERRLDFVPHTDAVDANRFTLLTYHEWGYCTVLLLCGRYINIIYQWPLLDPTLKLQRFLYCISVIDRASTHHQQTAVQVSFFMYIY